MSYSYDRTAGRNEIEWVEGEVLTRPVREALDAFLQKVVQEGQAVHRQVDRQWDWAVKNVQGGERVSKEDVVLAVIKAVSYRFGDDPLAKHLARAIALGEGLL